MGPLFFRIVEIMFASYMVPALLIPLVWVAAWIFKRRLHAATQPASEVEGQAQLLFWLFLVWFVLLLAVLTGVPLNRGGRLAVISCWIVYALTNLLLAWFLLRFTSVYGSIPGGRAADRVFLRFIAIIVTQPLMTAAAFAVLNNVMGVAWNAQVPEIPAIQEGI
ncbi:MAG: hypothetical protein QOD56_2746 [Gammaproteobacteria bacterium]|jgi:hypothetical protein|nr:hypothetical protein [Gammaproteobacteria bacterium]